MADAVLLTNGRHAIPVRIDMFVEADDIATAIASHLQLDARAEWCDDAREIVTSNLAEMTTRAEAIGATEAMRLTRGHLRSYGYAGPALIECVQDDLAHVITRHVARLFPDLKG